MLTRRIITANHTTFARHVDNLVRLRTGALAVGDDDYQFVDDLVFYLLDVDRVADLVDVYDRFAPTEIFAPGETALFSSLRFADDLMSCPATGADGAMVFTREGCESRRQKGPWKRSDTLTVAE